MNKECKFHPGRTLYQDTPVCSTCWYGMPEATRKAFTSGLIDEKKFMDMAKKHFATIQDFGGGHKHEKG